MVKGFAYNPSVISALETALSSDRLTAYLRETGGDKERALRLYLWNTEASAAFYSPLQGLEIALRNALHRELSSIYGAKHGQGLLYTSGELPRLAQRPRAACAPNP